MTSKTAIIIGAGIGGLTTAIALRRAGWHARVYERTPEIGAVGAGITLWPNALRVLDRLGVGDAVRAAGQPSTGGAVRDWQGKLLSGGSTDLIARRFGPLIGIHRADLHRVLLDALSPSVVQLGAECVGFEQDGRGATALFVDGAEVRGDVLIGADGLRSVVRAQMRGGASPRYAGYTAWRGVATIDLPDIPPGYSFETWGCGQRFGAVQIGGGRVYWYATRNTPEGQADAPAGRQQELLSLYKDWHAPIEILIQATPAAAILRNDIYDRPPVTQWTKGRVTLLGDAAHATTPNLGQGACQAIEDALVLAECLGQAEIEPALLAYQTRRIPRANRVVETSWRIGAVTRWSHPLACGFRNLLLRLTPDRVTLSQVSWLLDQDA